MAQPTAPLPILDYLQHAAQTSASPGDDTHSIYRVLGVEPIINCRGTFTIIGGSVERPETLAAYKEASRHFVQYDELAEGVGRRLAELTGAAWGLISDGCAAGLKHVTAACVTGGNPEKLIRLPDLHGMDKTQVIVPRASRNAYDHAVRNLGVEIVMVDTPEELAAAINPKTAMIYLMSNEATEPGQPLSLETVARLARPAGVPVLIDAAAENLTIPCVHLQRGADVVAYSGGKAMCGPQGAGLLLGRKDLLMAAWQASSPHHGPNRDNKIGREEILGMLAAVEAWVTRDHAAEWQTWLDRLAFITAQVTQLPGVTTAIEQPQSRSNVAPTLVVRWDPAAYAITGAQVAEDFARNKPRIAVGSRDADGGASIRITPSQMQPGQEQAVAARIVGILSAPRPPLASQMTPPAADLSGHWEVTVRYFTSTSRHRFYLHQEGNWLFGSHHSEYAQQEIVGTVEGEQVKLHSELRQPGNIIQFFFGGTVTADGFGGTVHLGEYLTAHFAATRVAYARPRLPVSIPGGPPLAT